jgi:cell division protein FtsI/penicillin-binding protein 2
MRTALRVVGVVAALALAAGLVTAALSGSSGDGDGDRRARSTTTTTPGESPIATAEAYLAAWEERNWFVMASLTMEPPARFVPANEEFLAELRAGDLSFERGAARLLEPDPAAVRPLPRAQVPFTVTMDLRGLGEWSYDARLDLVEAAEGWRVEWSEATLHPAFAIAGYDIRRTRSWPVRAPILDRFDRPIVSSAPAIEVGVEPQRITDRRAVAAAVEAHLGVTAAQLDAALDAPGVRPNWFVPLTQVSPERWEQIRDLVLPVPGVIIRDAETRVPPTPDFLNPTLGRVREITAEQLEELGAPYAVGDVVGVGGIEARYEQRLAGEPTGAITLLDEFGDVVEVLAEFPGRDARPVATTIDPAIQLAAQAALDGVVQPAALVAVDGATGEVRAVVSRPVDGFDRAIGGRYAPGSTFKIVTAYGLLGHGVTPETVVACPSTIRVGGRTFSNFEGGALGDVPFADVFRQSCNTGFIGLADAAGEDVLAGAAAAFGFGDDYSVGLTTYPGSFPEVVDATENAAAAIGQGRVEASPLHMASVGAAIASGTWHSPVLVRAPMPRDRAESRDLDPGASTTLRALMQQVVQSGTGTAANVPGRVMGGKTGTAQFDPNDPNRTHAWFVGWVETAEGPLGFAVLVEGGGVGGRVAAPIAREFVAALP